MDVYYPEDDLLKYLTLNVENVLDLAASDEKISKVNITQDYIGFIINPGLEFSRLSRTYGTISKLLRELSKSWKLRVFKGREGYYIFGDIPHDSQISINKGRVISLIFPFKKISCISYFNVIPIELVYVIIPKLSPDSLNRYVLAYPEHRNENSFKLITKEIYPEHYKEIMSVYNDIPPFMKWSDIYEELSFMDPYELKGILKNDKFVHRYVGNPKIVYLFYGSKIKRLFPLMYQRIIDDKIPPKPSWKRFYSILMNVYEKTPLYDYIITGKLPPGYRVGYMSMYDSLNHLSRHVEYMVYLLVTDSNIEYESEDDKFNLIVLSTSTESIDLIVRIFDVHISDYVIPHVKSGDTYFNKLLQEYLDYKKKTLDPQSFKI